MRLYMHLYMRSTCKAKSGLRVDFVKSELCCKKAVKYLRARSKTGRETDSCIIAIN